MTVKLTLPKSWAKGPAQRLVDTFVEAYNKKHGDAPLEATEHHFEKKDGFVVPFDAPVNSFMESGEDLFLKNGPALSMAALKFTIPTAECEQEKPAAKAKAKPQSSMAAAIAAADAKKRAEEEAEGKSSAAPKVPEATDGTLLCKRFGCNKRYDPNDNPDDACQHHSKPPVFHETRKFWSCCPEQIGWDWESFQAIKGCCVSSHSNETQGQRFLGGTEVRKEQEELANQGTPQRLGAKKSPLDKLSAMRRALVDLGIEAAQFDKARDAVKARHEQDDPERVWENVANELAKVFAATLEGLQA